MDGTNQLLMTPGRYIREHVFCFRSQREFAEALGYAQATLSRFESGQLPFSSTAQKRIRALAADRGVPWDNNWFFEVPIVAAAMTPASTVDDESEESASPPEGSCAGTEVVA